MKPSDVVERTAVEQIEVLLVEDSLDHQLLTRRALEQAGIAVHLADSAERALELLDDDAARSHLVLIDHGLPNMSGMELLTRVATMEHGPGAIMVTASSSSQLVIEAMRAGAIDFLAKESGYLALLPSVVQRAFRQYDLRRRTRELQRLALLVTRATRFEDTVQEVVAGAAKLLRAHAAILLVQGEDGDGHWSTVARIGEREDLRPDEVRAYAKDQTSWADNPCLAVELPREVDERAGILAVARPSGRPWLLEERDLAETFAAFASSALRHARRAELEGGLIEELQQTIRVRRDFLASVSHELRTPLTAIGGYAETVIERADQLEEPQRVDLVRRIRRNAAQLERMIDQLIDVARLERGDRFTATPTELSLADFVANSVEELRPSVQGRPLELDLPEVRVVADRELLHRVVANLLTNAAKYSPTGTVVEVRAEVLDGRVRVVVRDHGIGIEPSDAALIFQPFWRARHAVAQAVRGTGIGLALVREYLAEMGGEVGVQRPDDGVGSEFWFTLPLAS